MTLSQALPAAVAAAALALTGIVPGLWTDRWGPSPALKNAAALLDSVPLDLGGWHGERDELDPRAVTQADLAGYLARRYEKNDRQVSLLVVCGRPGPIARHTPDVCFRGQGFELVGGIDRFPVPKADVPTEFFVATMQKQTPGGPGYVRVFWAWNSAAAWEAIDNPRTAYARQAALFKLYVVQELTRPDEPLNDGSGVEFIRDAVPELNKFLHLTSSGS